MIPNPALLDQVDQLVLQRACLYSRKAKEKVVLLLGAEENIELLCHPKIKIYKVKEWDVDQGSLVSPLKPQKYTISWNHQEKQIEGVWQNITIDMV